MNWISYEISVPVTNVLSTLVRLNVCVFLVIENTSWIDSRPHYRFDALIRKTFENDRIARLWCKLNSMHHLQTHAPEIFSIIVSIMMRFRPSILIRFVCVFLLIHFQERFQIDVLSVRTEGLNASKCTRFQTKTHQCEQGLRGCYIRLLVENVLACQRTVARISRLQATIISARQAVFPSAHVSKS